MAFGDPSGTFFAFDAPSGERPVCLLDEAMDGATRGFSVLSRDIDAPGRGEWDPSTGTLSLDGAAVAVAVADAGVETSRALLYRVEDRSVALLGDDGVFPDGVSVLYPGYFDTVPAGQRVADLQALDDLPEPPEPDDEVDWADHHVAETRALARAESLI